MLKTSPIIDSAPNASPTFRYAPSAVSPHASPRHPTALRRASSSRSGDRPGSSSGDLSGKSPAYDRSMPPPPSSEGGLAAAHSRSVAAIQTADTSSKSTPAEPHPPPAPKPLTSSSDTASTQVSQPSDESVVAADSRSVEQTSALSPNKRRGSPSTRPVSAIPPSEPEGESSELAAKRSRHDERPAKILPSRYELCSVDDIVELIAHMIGELITTNDAIRVANGGLTRFHSR